MKRLKIVVAGSTVQQIFEKKDVYIKRKWRPTWVFAYGFEPIF